MKKLIMPIICLIVGISIGTHATTNNTQKQLVDGKSDISQVEFYDNMIANANTIEIYDTSELTNEIMNNRDGKIIVEKIIGKVVNQELDGEILNVGKNENYINYERVEGAKKGDVIVTYFIYNPFTNEQDDVLTRLDFIIDCHSI